MGVLAGTSRRTAGRALALGGATAGCGSAAVALAARVLELAEGASPAHADGLVEMVVLAAGVLALAWLAASAALTAACLAVRVAGRTWRRGEAWVHRFAPVVVRRALAVAVAAGVGIGGATGAVAADTVTAASVMGTASAGTGVSAALGDAGAAASLGAAARQADGTPGPVAPDTGATASATPLPVDLGWVVTGPGWAHPADPSAVPTPAHTGAPVTAPRLGSVSGPWSAPLTEPDAVPPTPPTTRTATGSVSGAASAGPASGTSRWSAGGAAGPDPAAGPPSRPGVARFAGPAAVSTWTSTAPTPAAGVDTPTLDRDADRPAGALGDDSNSPTTDLGGAGTVTVAPGDSLWAIAGRHLPPGSNDAQIAATWPSWYAANAATIGPDPGLIRPGQVLRVPAPEVNR